MKREQFISYLQNPKDLHGENAIALNNLLKEFPYFQSAQLLYLKTLHNESSVHYQSQLKIAAAYSASRKALYFLINDEASKLNKSEQIKPSNSFASATSSINATEQLLEEKEIQAEHGLTEELIDKVSEIIPESVLEVETESVSETEAANAVIEEKAELIESAVVEAEVNSIRMAEVEPLVEAAAEVEHVDVQLDATPLIPAKENSVAPESEIKQKESDGISNDYEVHTFLEWLERSKNLVNLSPVITAEPKVSVEPQKVEPKKSIPDEKRELIEKFITAEPRIVAKKQEFFNPVNKAKQSVMENDSIVSETLAKIYIKQNNFQRAIKSYEILSLKVPEKKTYFAAQILKIKELQQDRKDAKS